MVATDRNAIGLMRTLKDAGLVIPRDLAIVAFDNIAAGTFSTPTLSSVNQSFDDVGALAGRLILAKLRGEVVPNSNFRSESPVLMIRDSCGCDVDAQDDESVGTDGARVASRDLLREELTAKLRRVLERELLTGNPLADNRARDEIMDTVVEAVRLLELGDSVTTAHIQTLATSLQQLTSRPRTLRRFTDTMTNCARRAAASAPHIGEASASASVRVAAALWKVQAGAFLQQAEITDTAIAEQDAVDAGLLDIGGADPRDLRWLRGTRVKAGILALWEGVPSSGQLKVVGTYDPANVLPELVGSALPSEHFPPEALLARASASSREVCVVVRVSSGERDWGLLAVVAGICQVK